MELDQYQEWVSTMRRYPGKNSMLGLIYCALQLAGESGEFTGHLAKAIRDDGELTVERKSLMIKELGDILWYIAATAMELNITLNNVALLNIEKLKDREIRGVLAGSGDNR